MTNQEFAEALVKVFEPNPDLLHAVFDVISDERIKDKASAVQRLIELPAETTLAELEAAIDRMADEPSPP